MCSPETRQLNELGTTRGEKEAPGQLWQGGYKKQKGKSKGTHRPRQGFEPGPRCYLGVAAGGNNRKAGAT